MCVCVCVCVCVVGSLRCWSSLLFLFSFFKIILWLYHNIYSTFHERISGYPEVIKEEFISNLCFVPLTISQDISFQTENNVLNDSIMFVCIYYVESAVNKPCSSVASLKLHIWGLPNDRVRQTLTHTLQYMSYCTKFCGICTWGNNGVWKQGES